MAYIYKITNKVNEKLYIGQTSFSLPYRLTQHLNEAKHGSNRPLCRAIRKYGEENFIISLLEETENPNEREIFWIKELGSFTNGYNATTGGEGTSTIQKDEIIKVWEQAGRCSIKTLSKIVGHDYSYLCKLFKEWGIDFSYEGWKKQRKRVAQLDRETLEQIAEFDSLADAARAVGVNPKNSHISKVCDGKRPTAYGFKWRWL